jgi:DNA-binding transcriptional LysR family regulator
VLREVDDAVGAMREGGGAHGRLVVSASLTFGAAFIVPQLQKLSEKHPQLVIDLRLEDHLVDLIGEGVDVAVRSGSPPPLSTAYVAQRIFDMQRVLVAAPRYLRKYGSVREPEQLTRHAGLIQVTPSGVIVPWALRFRDDAEERTPHVTGRIRTNAPSALRSLALDGAGIAYLPEWLVSADIRAGALRRVLPEWASVSLTSWAVYRAELRGSPRLRAFLDALPRGPN